MGIPSEKWAAIVESVGTMAECSLLQCGACGWQGVPEVKGPCRRCKAEKGALRPVPLPAPPGARHAPACGIAWRVDRCPLCGSVLDEAGRCRAHPELRDHRLVEGVCPGCRRRSARRRRWEDFGLEPDPPVADWCWRVISLEAMLGRDSQTGRPTLSELQTLFDMGGVQDADTRALWQWLLGLVTDERLEAQRLHYLTLTPGQGGEG